MSRIYEIRFVFLSRAFLALSREELQPLHENRPPWRVRKIVKRSDIYIIFRDVEELSSLQVSIKSHNVSSVAGRKDGNGGAGEGGGAAGKCGTASFEETK